MVATAACGLGSRYEAPNQPWRARAWSPQPLTSMAPQWLLTAAGHRGRRQRPNLTLAQWARGAATGGPDCVESTEVPGRRCRRDVPATLSWQGRVGTGMYLLHHHHHRLSAGGRAPRGGSGASHSAGQVLVAHPSGPKLGELRVLDSV